MRAQSLTTAMALAALAAFSTATPPARAEGVSYHRSAGMAARSSPQLADEPKIYALKGPNGPIVMRSPAIPPRDDEVALSIQGPRRVVVPSHVVVVKGPNGFQAMKR